MASQTLQLSPQFVEEIDRLEILIRDTKSGVLAFAIYNTITGRERAVEELKARIALPIHEFTLYSHQKDPFACLATIPKDTRSVVFVLVAESAFPEVTGYANMQREKLRDYPHALVFWMTEPLMRRFARGALDFWDWRSGTFDFRPDGEEPLVGLLTSEPEDGLFGRRDMERRADLYLSLLRQEEQKPEADERYLASLNVQLAETLARLGQLDEADPFAEKGLALARRVGDRPLETAAIYALAQIRKDPGLLQVAIQAGGLTGRELARLTLVQGQLQARSGLIDAARSSFGTAAELFRVDSDSPGLANALVNAADVELRLDNLGQARRYYEEALVLFGPDDPGRSDALRGLALADRRQGEIARSRQHYLEAIASSRSAHDNRSLADSLVGLACLERDAGELGRARDIYKELAAISRRNRFIQGEAHAYFGLGDVETLSRDYSTARSDLERAASLYESSGYKLGLANTLRAIANLDVALGNWADARTRYERAIAIYRAHHENVGLAWSLGCMAQVSRELGDIPAYHRYLAEAEEAARKSQFPDAIGFVEDMKRFASAK